MLRPLGRLGDGKTRVYKDFPVANYASMLVGVGLVEVVAGVVTDDFWITRAELDGSLATR
jgi:hypothetical protein